MKGAAIITRKHFVLLALIYVVVITCTYFSTYQITTRPSSKKCGVTNRAVTFEYLTQGAKFCERTANRTSLLIGVASRVDNFENRAAIRDTWGGTALKMGFVLVFLLGTTPHQKVQRKVLAEHDVYGDIVQGDFVDSYRNLTYKTVMLIRWARQVCSETDFVLKIDDDMLLSVWDLAVVVNHLAGVKRSMWGLLCRHLPPNRNNESKWYVSKEEYAPDTYPDFLSGTGYLISGDAISALEGISHEECFFPLEDVYLTGIVAARAQVSRIGLDGFSNEHKPYYTPCSTPRVVTSHWWSPKALRSGWSNAVKRLNFGLCVGIKQNQMLS